MVLALFQICVPPLSHISAAALEVWDDPHAVSCIERCEAIQDLVAKQAYTDQALSETAEIVAKRGQALSNLQRYRQAEKVS